MMVIGFSNDACFIVAELMLMDVCVGTVLPYFNFEDMSERLFTKLRI